MLGSDLVLDDGNGLPVFTIAVAGFIQRHERGSPGRSSGSTSRAILASQARQDVGRDPFDHVPLVILGAVDQELVDADRAVGREDLLECLG